MILMRANPLLRPLEGMGPENLDFLKVDSNEKEGDQEGDSNSASVWHCGNLGLFEI
jgi:hypothetical protein